MNLIKELAPDLSGLDTMKALISAGERPPVCASATSTLLIVER